MERLILAIGIIVSIGVNGVVLIFQADDNKDQIIATIKDSGCNSHKQLHIEQEHTLRIDNYNLNSLRGE